MSKPNEETNTNIPLTEAESYQALLRSLRRRKGFNLLFVRCSPLQASRIIEKIKMDLSYKKSAVLTLDSETDNVYQEIQAIPNYKDLNILFIQGLETALLRYEEAESEGKILPSQSKVYGGSWSGVPKILGQLNLSRERFYQNFAFAIVILLPEFALRYFIRRAPDFFDWRSGLYEFPLDQKSLHKEINRLVYLESDFAKYREFTPQQRQEKLAEIKAYLTDDPNLDSSQAALLWFEKGLILHSCNELEEAILSYDKAIEFKPDYHEAYYNKACVYALQNNVTLAVENLQRAINLNGKCREMANNDSDFDSIRDDEQFKL
ncbi:MAG: tetratricopeptide repeat protein [Microcystaceae cyanobacterium]